MDFPFLNELNPGQRAAVTYTGGPSLVIAGAGSGKTRVITYKIAYLLHTGLPPESIMALTFTNKAAREMRNRVGQMIGEEAARHLWMGTFHSVFSRILRAEAAHIGHTSRYTIYDATDSKSLVRTIIKGKQLDEKLYKPEWVHACISLAKNSLVTPQTYAAHFARQGGDSRIDTARIAEIYAEYCTRCKQADAMDFDDLLLKTNLLFRDCPDLLQKYRQMFRYILVDEYQDTNFAQYLIVKKLSEEHKNVFVVGDDAQSIYSFRGANIDNILTFRKTYPSARLFKLEQNYRSTQSIVNASNSLIDKNKEQIKKIIFSQREKGTQLKVTGLCSDIEEGDYVADTIGRLCRRGGYTYDEIAVLYRTNSQSSVMENALLREGIPYKIHGSLSFYQRKGIKDVLGYFRLICNPHDEEALRRVINYPRRGIGRVTIEKLFACAQRHRVSAWQVLASPAEYGLDVHAGTQDKLKKFYELIKTHVLHSDSRDAYQMAQAIIEEAGIWNENTPKESPDESSDKEHIQELLKTVYQFCEDKRAAGEQKVSLSDYLSETSLLTDQDTDGKEAGERVTLMTVHAAKGLEFRVVFVVGMEEELFPLSFCTGDDRALEEERRLFYVALTRAGERCYLSFAHKRFRNGQHTFPRPSRFIRDIDPQYLDYPEEKSLPSRFFDTRLHEPPCTFPKTPTPLTKIEKGADDKLPKEYARIVPGACVTHTVFGLGKVLSTSFDEGNAKAVIDFGEKGQKTLLLKFARLEVLK